MYKKDLLRLYFCQLYYYLYYNLDLGARRPTGIRKKQLSNFKPIIPNCSIVSIK